MVREEGYGDKKQKKWKKIKKGVDNKKVVVYKTRHRPDGGGNFETSRRL